MNKLIKYLLIFVFLIPVAAGCKKQDVGEYENDPRLYFNYSYLMGSRDSIVYSFFFQKDDVMRDTVVVGMRTMGLSSSQPRSFLLRQTNAGEKGAAVPGVHFVPLEETKHLWNIPAYMVMYDAPVILLRDPSLNEGYFVLSLEIVENENFGSGISDNQTFNIYMTSKAEQPANWSSWAPAFGVWGERKMWFIMNYVGITNFEQRPSDTAYSNYLKSIATKLLLQYNSENPTLTEADGTEVKFG